MIGRRVFGGWLAAAALLAAPAGAVAQEFPVKLMGFSGQQLRGAPIAIPAYQIAFFTQHQGTAVGGVLTKSRLTTTLTGVSEAAMRGLVDEAYADLRSRFEAAGVPLVGEAETRAAVQAAGVELIPGNREVTRIGASITIGDSVKKAYAAYGAAKAPAVQGLHSPGNATGSAIMGTMAINGKIGAVAKAQQSILVMPGLAIDFAKTEAKAGRDFLGRESAGVSNRLAFTLSGVSQASLASSAGGGRFVTPGMMRLGKDLSVPTAFGTIATGEGAVRALSVATVTDSNYIDRDAARGDAAVVDEAAWKALVRQAYTAFNIAVVAEVRKAQGK